MHVVSVSCESSAAYIYIIIKLSVYSNNTRLMPIDCDKFHVTHDVMLFYLQAQVNASNSHRLNHCLYVHRTV